MVQTRQTNLATKLAALLAVALPSLCAAAGTEALATDGIVQPRGLNHAGVYALRHADPNLTGAGVKFAVVCRSITYDANGEPQNDYRPNIAHNCFRDTRLTFSDRNMMPAGISPHSTAICSILLGEDPDRPNSQSELARREFYYQGVAPRAEAEVYEFWHFLFSSVSPQAPPEADIVTASIGYEFEEWWTRGIEAMVEHSGLIVVAGIGNGSNAYEPPLYPAASANVIGVGVVDSVNTEDPAARLANFALACPEHSTLGPTAGGRCKPDIVAPGNCLAADADDPNTYTATGDWSSFATPIVAGTAGLLVQTARQDPTLSAALSPKGGNCVIRAVLMNSATKLPYWHKGRLDNDDDHTAPLDYVQGAGMLNALAAHKQLAAGQNRPGKATVAGWDNNVLHTREQPQQSYKISLAEPEGKLITVTAVWNRHYNKAYPFEPIPAKDADLRLELWAIDPNDAANDYLLDFSDSNADNVEHIYCPADANYTDYEIVLSISDAADRSATEIVQQYGLAWNCSTRHDTENIFWYDLNADGIVNEADFVILIDNLLRSRQSSEGYLLGDVNADGVIDAADAEILFNRAGLKADWRKE